MIVCVPVTEDGLIDPRWGRADRVAVSTITDGRIAGWQDFAVGWGGLHDTAGEGDHHARIARFLKEHDVQVVVAGHMGPPMQNMLAKMRIEVHLGAGGPARQATLGALATRTAP
jgi:predicted Fe-Mo cluster-binding NifX family protein